MPMLDTLNAKLEELLALREELETREEMADSIDEKKELIQGIIDLTHQIQALRVVIKLFFEEEQT
jgi:hypothetical protein